MSTAYDSIRKGLEEALAHARGEDVGARVHKVDVPEPDVAAIRARSGLSQAEFARSIGHISAAGANGQFHQHALLPFQIDAHIE